VVLVTIFCLKNFQMIKNTNELNGAGVCRLT
jgi:hypothetical protein